MSEKSWQRPWSIDEIIQNASNWSLAGDAGLLKHLEEFSERLLSKTETTNNNLNDLLAQLNNTSLSLDEVKNNFHSLRNTQFIESRVYEDDETIPESNEESNQDKQINDSQKEDSKIQNIKDAILAGIEVVDKYFDKVEVPGSDSEDDVDFPSFILKPKDPYVDRPLPHVIGTDEWYRKWHVGLIDSSSDSEPDKVSEKYSESDSDTDLTKDKIVNLPVANSTFDESVKPNLFSASDAEDNNSTPSYLSSANKNFANELAAKLGNFVDEQSNIKDEVNRRPINTAPHIQNFGNLFSDEPPPIDDFIDNNNVTGLFSGGEGLFDDMDNSSNLWNESQKVKSENKGTKNKISSLFDDDLEDDLFSNTVTSNEGIRRNDHVENKTTGLFDDEDDGLFNNNNITNAKTNSSYLQSHSKLTLPYIADEPPEVKSKVVEDSDSKSKKPIGGVKIMDTSDLFVNQKLGTVLKQRRQNSSSSESDDKIEPPVVEKVSPKKKVLSLFDDEDDDFEKDLFSTSYLKKDVKVPDNIEVNKNIDVPKELNIPVSINKVNETVKQEHVIKTNKPPEPKTISLFDDVDDEEKSDDLFSDSLFAVKPQVQNKDVHVPPLFDSNPPELDDHWDRSSDNNLFEDDAGLFDNIPEMSSQRSGLFDNEPPSLFFESSGIAEDISPRDTTNESFTPNASSSRRFSSDIFNEQQLSDSFFITQSKAPSNLGVIAEASYIQANDSSNSRNEITPSGNVDDLFSNLTNITTNISEDIKYDENVILRKNSSDTIESSPSKDSPGKLKHNLNINVNALMPGASPPKKQAVERTISLEVPSNEEENVKRLSLKSTDDLSSFENVVKDVEVLPSITKTRAKIPFKRAPSRRAQQESLRKSVPDFKDLTSNNDNNVDPVTSPSIPHSKSDEFVDIFDEEIKETTHDFLEGENLFENNEKTDILSIAEKVVSVEEVPEPVVVKTDDYKQINLFDDSEEFDDIFSTKKLPPKSTILSKSLFENDDDDDDVFGTSSFKKKGTSKTNVENKNVPKKPIMTTQVKKLENSTVVEDPLSSFLDE